MYESVSYAPLNLFILIWNILDGKNVKEITCLSAKVLLHNYNHNRNHVVPDSNANLSPELMFSKDVKTKLD